MSDDKKDWSLRKELQKRKTQQTSQTPQQPPRPSAGQPPKPSVPAPGPIDPRRPAGVTPPPPPARRTGQLQPLPPGGPRSAQTVPSPSAIEPEKPKRFPLRGILIGVIGVMTLVLVVSVVLLVTGGNPPAPTATPAPVAYTAQQVIDYLRLVGVPLGNLQELTVPNQDWGAANQGFQFNVVRGQERGAFIVLGYPAANARVADALRAANSEKYGKWPSLSETTILALADSTSAGAIREEVFSHILTLLLGETASRRATPTGTPALIAFGQTQTAFAPFLTQTAFAALPTATLRVVTLGPRTLEPVSTEVGLVRTALPEPTLRPTSTPRPTRTPFTFGLPTRTPTSEPLPPTPVPPVGSEPTQDPNAGAVITAEPQPPEINPGPTQPPNVVVNGTPVAVSVAPTVPPAEANSMAFNGRVPQKVGPFTLDPQFTTVNQYGSTLIYYTSDGAQYLAVLWLTNSAAEAYERFYIDLQSITTGYQSVPGIGDSAIVTGPGEYILAEAFTGNMVLMIFRPDQMGTTPTVQVTDSDAIALLRALYEAIPR